MAYKRTITTDFWTDPKVDDEFTPEDKYFYLYLLTNPHTNICGCYEIGVKQFERETGYTWDTIQRLLERFETYHKVIKFNTDTKEILLLNWGKYNWGKSEKVIIAVQTAAEKIKCENFKEYVLGYINSDSNSNSDSYRYSNSNSTSTSLHDSVSIQYPYSMLSTDNPQNNTQYMSLTK